MNEAGPEVANIAFDFADIFPEGVQLGDQYSVAVGLPVLPAGDYGPGHDDDQDSERPDHLADLGQPVHG